MDTEKINFLNNVYKNLKLWGPVTYDRTEVCIPKRLSEKELILESFYLTNEPQVLCEIRPWENTIYITRSLIFNYYGEFGEYGIQDFLSIINYWITSRFEIGTVEELFVLPDEDFLQKKRTIFVNL